MSGSFAHCPEPGDHSLAAVRYQLFAAFSIGYDGHQAPCDLKCVGREGCTQRCQLERGLAFLGEELGRLKDKQRLNHCASYRKLCIEQCREHGEACAKTCRV